MPAIHVDLFSGIGEFSLAAEANGLRTVVFVECDPDRQRDLAHHWPGVPIVGDVNDVDAIVAACRPGGRPGVGTAREDAAQTAPGVANQRAGGTSSERAVVADAASRVGGEQAAGNWRQVHAGGVLQAHPVVANTECTGPEASGYGEHNAGQAGSGQADQCGSSFLQPFLLTAGVPCQPASAAGKRQGSADHRWLWPQTLRVVERLRPRWCLFENPLGIASLSEPAAIPGVDLERLRQVPGRTICEILTAVDALGYELPLDRDGIPWVPVVPAAGVGAFHQRDRLWIIARRRDVADPIRQRGRSGNSERQDAVHADSTVKTARAVVGYVDSAGRGTRPQSQSSEIESGSSASVGTQPSRFVLPTWSDAILEQGCDEVWRAVEPSIRLLVDGLPGRVAKLRGLGNSICPQVAQEIIRAIIETELNP